MIATVVIASSTDPCYVAKNLVPAPCVTGSTNNTNFIGNPVPGAPLPGVTPPAWGTTAAQIQQDFPASILYDFETNPSLTTVLTAMQPIMLARLSTELAALDTSGDTHWILVYAAEKVSAPALRLLQSAFGPTMMASALPYASAATQAAYNALPVSAPLQYSQYWISLGNTLPPFASSMYMYDLFLDQYLSTTDSVTVALHKATTYLQVRVKAGPMEIIGGIAAIMGIITFFDPNAWQDIQDALAWGSELKGVITIPDPTIEWPQPVAPDLPTFPPIESPPDDIYFCPGLDTPC